MPMLKVRASVSLAIALISSISAMYVVHISRYHFGLITIFSTC